MRAREEMPAREPFHPERTRKPSPDQRVLMTLRVSRDSGRTWGRTTEVQEAEHPVFLDNPGRFPPCACPRCAHGTAGFAVSPEGGS